MTMKKILVSLINISLRLISSIRDKTRIFMDILDFQTMIKKTSGLSFNNKKQFLPFKAFDIRKASDKKCKGFKGYKIYFL